MAEVNEGQQQRAAERGAAREERGRQKDAGEEPSYPVDRLLAESHDFFGRPEHVVAGALELRSGPAKQNYTRAEVVEAIDAFDAYVPEEG